MPKRRLRSIKTTQTQSAPGYRTLRLSISIGIFLALAIIKLLDPNGAARMGKTLNGYIGDQTPITVQALGEAIAGGGTPAAVFQNLSDVITGRGHQVSNPGETENSVGASAEDNAEEPSPEPEQTGTPEPLLSASEYQSTNLISRSMPWRGTIEVASEEDYITGGGFGIDDTLPLPFGYDAPPNVDFTVYEFDFETATPITGVTSSGFGYRIHPIKNQMLFHYGTDLSAVTGTDIHSFADGTVSATGSSASYGNYLLIEHKDGVSSFYAHCSKVLVKKGAEVKLGQVVAKVGSTGQSTGPHLHFELRRDGMILDPENYI